MRPLAGSRVTRRRPERVACGVLVVLGCACLLAAQSLPRAVNLASLVAYPDFYADRTLVARGYLRVAGDGRLFFEDEAGHRVLTAWRERGRPDGQVEATGQLWDLGRLKQDDTRLSGFDLSGILRATRQEWPRPGDVYVFAVSSSHAVENSPVTTIRSVVLEGGRAIGRLVTVTGQFRGRNLFGDLPQAPGSGRSDFVLRASDASIWVSGKAPKGKDFDLDPSKRVDTDRWLRVTGVVRQARGLTFVEAKSVELAERASTEAEAPAKPAAPAAPLAPPEVLFSVPVQGETDVSPSTTVRIQLSRDLDPQTLQGRVRVAYLGAANAAAPSEPPKMRLELDERERVLTVRFVQPLEPWQRVQVDLLDGIKGTDGTGMKAWTLRFTVGGQ